MIIDWKKIAKEIYEKLKAGIKATWKVPSLWVILVWNNPSSAKYVEQKKKWAEYVWINFNLYKFDENISENELLIEIEKLNNDKNISWFIVQLPLPNHIDDKKIINAINPEKDVDWFHPINQGKILIWDNSWLAPCTPSWIMEIFSYYNINLSWKIVTIVWKSNIVWKPIALMLINAWATVISCNSKTPDISKFTLDSDIIISATWVAWIIKKEMIKENSILIDVWFSYIDWKIYWDMDFENLKEKSSMITPVPGWVGAMTVAILLKNTLKAAK